MIHTYQNPPKWLPENTFPLPLETVSQFVIQAKFAHGGREPGSRKNMTVLSLRWIPLRLSSGW